MNHTTIKIPAITFQGLLISEKTIVAGELFRIELGNSHGTKRESFSKLLQQEMKRANIISINDLKKRKKIKDLLQSKRVNDYLLEHEIPKEEAEKLITLSKANQLERINKDSKLADLTAQEFRLLKIYVLQYHHRKIFIETAGMYLSVLIGTYKILKDFLKAGGIVIELAYPHFEKTDELQWMATKDLIRVQIGEMEIDKR